MKYARGGMTSLDYLMEIQRLENELKKYGWVSVKDRLPEPNTTVLVYYVYQDGYGGGRITTAIYDERFKFIIGHEVTHWMPLPTPPESEDDAND